jgi:hypothetical protein
MKHRGGVPPVFNKKQKVKPLLFDDKPKVPGYIPPVLPLPPAPAPPRQTVKSGLEQLMGPSRPKSPFTGPGPSTAGRRTKRRKLKRRS